VQFDSKRKVPARLIAANPDKDVAVLWVNLSAFPESVVAPIAAKDRPSPIVVGQRVFTIGNPLGRDKVLTSASSAKSKKIQSLATSTSIPEIPAARSHHGGRSCGPDHRRLRNLASIVP